MVRGSNVVEIFRHAPKPAQKRPLDMLHLAKQGVAELMALQKKVL